MKDQKTTTAQSAGSAPATRRQSIGHARLLQAVRRQVPFQLGVIVSAMPTGALHIIEPAGVPSSMHKAFSRGMHRHATPVWQAIVQGRAISASDIWSEAKLRESEFYAGFLARRDLLHLLAVPLESPLFHGYPGAIVLMRSSQEADFSRVEARRVFDSIAQAREAADGDTGAVKAAEAESWAQDAPVRFYVFGRDARLLWPEQGIPLDATLVQGIERSVRQGLAKIKGNRVLDDRLLLPDVCGDAWVFHRLIYSDCPALGGKAAIVCLHPRPAEWASVQAEQVSADPEMARMLSAVRYMYERFEQGPRLHDTAQRTGLSSFHFHRRFAALFGQTPKHYLLSRQMEAVKAALLEGERTLAQISDDYGFAHQSHFTSRFRQATGMTPTVWRRMAFRRRAGMLP